MRWMMSSVWLSGGYEAIGRGSDTGIGRCLNGKAVTGRRKEEEEEVVVRKEIETGTPLALPCARCRCRYH